MRKKIIIMLIVAFIAGFFSGAFIPDIFKKENLTTPSSKFLSNYLSLSKTQEKKIESLNSSFYTKMQRIRAQLDQKRAELGELLREASPDQKKIKDKIREIASLQMQLQEETVKHLEKIKVILTPQQREKFFSLIRKGLHPKRRWRKRF